jgi:hypothetical protein
MTYLDLVDALNSGKIITYAGITGTIHKIEDMGNEYRITFLVLTPPAPVVMHTWDKIETSVDA